jgi:hypothetical protein
MKLKIINIIFSEYNTLAQKSIISSKKKTRKFYVWEYFCPFLKSFLLPFTGRI